MDSVTETETKLIDDLKNQLQSLKEKNDQQTKKIIELSNELLKQDKLINRAVMN